ncbi:MAG TPA: hypothetical protein DEB33_06755 [Gemmatimonadetes bacterium]|nr:hypothetical protein [Gemmatimonadota bacterium]
MVEWRRVIRASGLGAPRPDWKRALCLPMFFFLALAQFGCEDPGPTPLTPTPDGSSEGTSSILSVIETQLASSQDFGYQIRYELEDLNGDGLIDVLGGGWVTVSQCSLNGACADGTAPPAPDAPLWAVVQTKSGKWVDGTRALQFGGETGSWNRALIDDFNGNGIPDLFLPAFWDIPVVHRPSSWALDPAGNGSWTRRAGPDTWAHGASVVDANLDGCPDVVTADATWYLNDCGGNFTFARFHLNGCDGNCALVDIQNLPDHQLHIEVGGTDICIADLTGDLVPELLFIDAAPIRGDGQGVSGQDLIAVEVEWGMSVPQPIRAVALPVPLFDRGNQSGRARSHDRQCQIGDLDGDGLKDVLVSSTRWPELGGRWEEVNALQVYRNQGNLQFEDISDRAFPGRKLEVSSTERFALTDLNGDGSSDLFLSSGGLEGSDPHRVWLGHGDGSFRRSEAVDFDYVIHQAREAAVLEGFVTAEAQLDLGSGIVIPLERPAGGYDFLVPLTLWPKVEGSGMKVLLALSPYGAHF